MVCCTEKDVQDEVQDEAAQWCQFIGGGDVQFDRFCYGVTCQIPPLRKYLFLPLQYWPMKWYLKIVWLVCIPSPNSPNDFRIYSQFLLKLIITATVTFILLKSYLI